MKKLTKNFKQLAIGVILGLAVAAGIWLASKALTKPKLTYGYPGEYPAQYRNEKLAFDSVETAQGSVPSPAAAMPEPGVSVPGATDSKYKIYNAYVNVYVTDITQFKDSVVDYVTTAGGYVVTERITTSTPTIPDLRNMQNPDKVYKLYLTVRIPTQHLTELVNYITNMSKEVVSVSINGADITDQYRDLTRELRLLETTYARLEEIYQKATNPKDLLNIQRQMLQVQRDIDRIKGRLQAIEKQSKYARVTIVASTDKYALDYMPKNIWDISTTLKMAVRTLMYTLATISKALIWILVFSPLLVVTYFACRFVYRKIRSRIR